MSACSRSSGCLPLSRKSNGNSRPGSGSSAYLGTIEMGVQVGEGVAQRQGVQPHRPQVLLDRRPGAQRLHPEPGRLLGR